MNEWGYYAANFAAFRLLYEIHINFVSLKVSMAKRKGLSIKIRFEVFKRDSFTCQYCGQKAPDVLLELDHIDPVSKGGANDILNLITSCKGCNRGKSNRTLADSAVLDKRRQQLEELQERKEQIEMMFEWQKGLLDLNDEVVSKLANFWSEQVPGYHLNENGIKGLKKLNKRFEVDEIMAAIKIAAEHYLEYGQDGPTKESVECAWRRVGGICNTRRQEKNNPHIKRIYYIRGILRNRLSYLNETLALQLLSQAVALNADLDSLENHAKSVRNWTQWRQALENYINEHENVDDEEEEHGVDKG